MLPTVDALDQAFAIDDDATAVAELNAATLSSLSAVDRSVSDYSASDGSSDFSGSFDGELLAPGTYNASKPSCVPGLALNLGGAAAPQDYQDEFMATKDDRSLSWREADAGTLEAAEAEAK